MFTGIIEGMGTVRRMTRKGGDALIDVEGGVDLSDVRTGDSIAVNGACLTVTAKTGGSFTADVSAETLARTTLKLLKAGDKVNLEKAMRLSSFLGGHLVLGHVDGTGTIRERSQKSNSLIFGIGVDASLMRYIVEKGSIAVDGVSLTVNRCEKGNFYVNMIPHTAQVTTLGSKQPSDPVNIETDILGKYVEKFLAPRKGLDMDFLAEHGFK